MKAKIEIVTNMLIKSPVRGKKRIYDDIDIYDINDVSTGVLNSEVDIGLLTTRLSDSARAKATRVISVNRAMGEYICPSCRRVCGDNSGDAESIMCDSCLEWLHIFPCSGERKIPRSKYWYCNKCK